MPSVILEVNPSPKFTFLAPPPPPKKKRAAVNDTFRAPTSPVHSPRAILAWAKDVHPGSPAPMTPVPGASSPVPRSTSISSPLLQAFRQSSLHRDNSFRQSVSSITSKIPSTSFFHFADTRNLVHPIPATPFSPDVKVDLTAFGYASTFVDIPVSTPSTPEIYRPTTYTPTPSDVVASSFPAASPLKPNAPGVLKRFLGTKSKAKSRTQIKGIVNCLDPGASSPVASAPSKKHRTGAENSPGSIGKRKRGLCADYLPLTTKEDAWMRKASLGSNIKRAMEEVALREGPTVKISLVDRMDVVESVGSAYRGELGGIWWDQEEGCESSQLSSPTEAPLSAQYPNAEGWVTYNHLKELEREDSSGPSSFLSTKRTDSCHPRPLPVVDWAADQLVCGRAAKCSSIAGSIVFPSSPAEPSSILLAVPSRPKRGRHLKPGFLKDVIAVPPTPTSPSVYSQTSCPPRSPAHAARFIVNSSAKPRSLRRQRSRSRSLSQRQRKPVPPPLKIVPTRPVNKLAVNADPCEDDRKTFLEDSKPGPYVTTSRWSMDTIIPGPPPVRPGNVDKLDDFGSVNIPKKSKRLGGFFKKNEKIV